jgi:hypothetical protein
MSDLIKKESATLPAWVQDEAMSNHGTDFEQSDLSYGWLRIAQSQTEAAVKGSDVYIPGLEPGMYFNTMTKRVYGNDVKVIVLKYFRSWTEQTDDSPGKFVRVVEREEFDELKPTLEQDGSKWRGLPNGNVITETMNYMVALPDDPEAGFLRFGLSAGGFKAGKKWNTLISMKRTPSYTQVWKLVAKFNKGEKGNYYTIGADGNFAGEFAGWIDEKSLVSVREMAEFLNLNHDKVQEGGKAEQDF